MSRDLGPFRTHVREFIQREFCPELEEWRRVGRPDAGAWKKAGAAGLLALEVPGEYGGPAETFAHEAVVLEELARHGISFGVREQSIVAHYLLAYGSDIQRRRWLPALVSGELVAAIAMTEPGAGSDLMGIRTSASLDGDHYVIDGGKTFITNGALAGLVCLAVRTGPSGPAGLSLILVETSGLEGYRVSAPLPKLGQHEQDTTELSFDRVRIPRHHLLGSAEGEGFFQMMEQLPRERLIVSVSAQATAARAVELTSARLKRAEGECLPLIDDQALRFALAHCLSELAVGRVFLDECIGRYIRGRLEPETAAIAKLWLTGMEGRVLERCLALGGPDEPGPTVLSQALDSRMHRIGGGTTEILQEIIGWSV